MFDKIWKEQISQQKGKLGIWKPKEELKPREDNNEECCEKARAYYISQRINTERKGYLSEEEWWDSNRRWAKDCDKYIEQIRRWKDFDQKFDENLYQLSRESLKIYDDCMGE